MSDDQLEKQLLARVEQRDREALSELFALYRARLKAMIRLRLNPRLQRRIDASDIVQETLLDASNKFDEYAAAPKLPVYLWLRALAALKLAEAHRTHLATQKRAVHREIPIVFGNSPAAPTVSSIVLAGELVSAAAAPPDQAIQLELRQNLHQLLDGMEPLDREVLVLRHFEQLTTAEAAHVLEMTEAAASSRYLRALKKLRSILAKYPGIS